MKVVAVSTSTLKGVPKENQKQINLIVGLGVENDAHAAPGKRQVSLLAQESINKMITDDLCLRPGDFAENITTCGLELHTYPLGTRFKIGSETILELSQIGKTCHHGCAIKEKVGTCIMPLEGVFCEVITPGSIKPNDIISIL